MDCSKQAEILELSFEERAVHIAACLFHGQKALLARMQRKVKIRIRSKKISNMGRCSPNIAVSDERCLLCPL